MRSACGIPDNGGGPCLEGARLEAIEAEQRRERLWREELRDAFRAQNSEIGGIKEAVHGLEGDMLDQVAAVAGVVGEVRGLRRDMKLAVRPPLVSLDWDRDEPTLHGNKPDDVRASEWKDRATRTAEQLDAEREARIQAELKAAKWEAKAEEHSRHSERARSDNRWAWSMRTKVIIAIATSGGIGAVIGAIAKWLL